MILIFSIFSRLNHHELNTYNMSAPKLEDLPKVADDLKSQLEHFSTDKLKDTVTNEKIVLPTAEGTYASLYHVC